MYVQLINYTQHPELAIARAGGVSHDNDFTDYVEDELAGGELKDARDLVAKFIEWDHETPLEFADATFKVSDVSRSFLAQVTRHRLASFMVESMRYVEQADQWPIIPDSIGEIDDKEFQLEVDNLVETSHWLYDQCVSRGVPKEDARFLLPIGSRTKLYMKANFREWRHIIDLRASAGAQWEIRDFAQRVLTKLHNIAPSAFQDQLPCTTSKALSQ